MKFCLFLPTLMMKLFQGGGGLWLQNLPKEKHKVSLITATKGEAGEAGNPPITTMDKGWRS